MQHLGTLLSFWKVFINKFELSCILCEFNWFSKLNIVISVIETAMCLYYWLSLFVNRSVNPEPSQHLTAHTAVVRVSVLHTLLFHAECVVTFAKWCVCSLSLHNKFHAVVTLQSAVQSVYLINLSKHLLLSHTGWQEGS